MKHILKTGICFLLCPVLLLTGCAGFKGKREKAEIVPITAEASDMAFETPSVNETSLVSTPRAAEALYAMYGLKKYPVDLGIPHYFQTDYPDVAFSDGTIETHGCGITSLAMIASYLLDQDIYPDEMARRFDAGSNPAAAMESGIKHLDLNCEVYYGDKIHENVWSAVEEGRPVIALMQTGSLFTADGHFVVFAGMTEDGKYVVQDPNKMNYEKEELANGFRNGFTRDQLVNGLNGVYIFDKKTVSEKEELGSILSIYTQIINSRTK